MLKYSLQPLLFASVIVLLFITVSCDHHENSKMCENKECKMTETEKSIGIARFYSALRHASSHPSGRLGISKENTEARWMINRFGPRGNLWSRDLSQV